MALLQQAEKRIENDTLTEQILAQLFRFNQSLVQDFWSLKDLISAPFLNLLAVGKSPERTVFSKKLLDFMHALEAC